VVGAPCEGQEDIVEIWRMDGDPFHLDGGTIEAIEQGSKRAPVSVAGDLESQRVVILAGCGKSTGCRLKCV
jgi:hypothetical protein